jgi:peptide/nickel transport system permease protein
MTPSVLDTIAVDPTTGEAGAPHAAVAPGSLALPTLGTGRSTRAGRRLRVGPALAGLFVLLIIIAAVAPAVLTSRQPDAVNLGAAFQAPSLSHLMGTDASGRDEFTRLVYGARESLLIGLGATATSMILALGLGFLAGLCGGVVDGLVNRFLEVLFAFPALLLALLFVAVAGPGIITEIIAVGVGNAPGYARMVRGQVLSVKNSPYVEAAEALGHSRTRVVLGHVFPNAIRPLVVLATMGVGQSIVWASALAFLGLGVAPPASEWGALLDAGRNYVTQAWWLEIFPGLAIVGCALSMTSLGRYLQQRLEGALT